MLQDRLQNTKNVIRFQYLVRYEIITVDYFNTQYLRQTTQQALSVFITETGLKKNFCVCFIIVTLLHYLIKWN